MKILIIIDSLEVGGAEVFLEDLTEQLIQRHEIEIVTLSSIGVIGNRMIRSGIKVTNFHFNSSILPFRQFLLLYQHIHQTKPDIVHTWMYFSNFLGGIAAFLARVKNILWSIHNFNISKGFLKKRTIFILKISAYLAYLIPKKIIFCSEESLKAHHKIRYPKNKLEFIPNAIDVRKFIFSYQDRTHVRSELKISQESMCIGMIGRYDPVKNQAGFIEAASLILNQKPDTYFFIAGRGVDTNNKTLINLITSRGLENNFFLLGERGDVNKLLCAMDIFVLPSFGEAFPISLCEAMSCGIPCVASNVGDVKFILGNERLLIKPGDVRELTDKILEIISLTYPEREVIGSELKKRVKEKFTIESVSRTYSKLYNEFIIS